MHFDVRSYGEEGAKHAHECHHQLVLPVQGTLALSINHIGGEVDEHHGAIIVAGSHHEYSAREKNGFLVADIPHRLAPRLDRLPPFITLNPSLQQYVRFLYQHQLGVGGRSSSQYQMLLLFIQLIEEVHHHSVSVDHRVAAVKAFLDSHFAQKITANTLAQLAHLSVRQLNNVFKQAFGLTPHQYLLERRMREAMALLQSTDLSIQQIADQVGYGSLSVFSERFARYFGRSPKYFR